jgi:hypothetical protein
LRCIESEFELFVGCHNVGFNYDTTFSWGVGHWLSKPKNSENIFPKKKTSVFPRYHRPRAECPCR